ncbi:hypothetical protein [Croceicoccus sp. Ery5]|uniref:hypothetical protein n=1 Tax=Croceicoccus sp. Ery5 TaxID=1703340 RepID=UPI001E3C34AF|nr:hypothetical protein [Croceicoccus sp. Ery5]
MKTFHWLVSAPAMLAASGLALPAQAAVMQTAVDVQGPTLSVLAKGNQAGWDRGRRYRGHGHGHGRYDDNIDAGDVIAGILLIGGIAAVASAIANDKDKQRDEYRERYPYPDDRPYPQNGPYPDDARYPDNGNAYPDDRYRSAPAAGAAAGGGIQGAIDRCVAEVERQDRVATVDDATRSGQGWTVQGGLRDGGQYRCEIDGAGKIRDLNVGGSDSYGWTGNGRQTSSYGQQGDDYYANARARQGMGTPDRPVGNGDVHAGDIYAGDDWRGDDWQAGDDGQGAAEEQDWQRGESDDRYQTSSGTVVALAQ